MKSIFPPATEGDEDGVVAISRNVTPEMLLDAYYHGIFPWPFEEASVLWCSPKRRGILPIDEVHIPKSLARVVKQKRFKVSVDTCFEQVIDACATVSRPDGPGTWITRKMRRAYGEFHRLGYAHSFESFNAEGRLVGGLYGVLLGRLFCGESMFHYENDASKVAFCAMVDILGKHGVQLIDTQMVTPATAIFGAREIPIEEYLRLLEQYRSPEPTSLAVPMRK